MPGDTPSRPPSSPPPASPPAHSPPSQSPPPTAERIEQLIRHAELMGEFELVQIWELLWRDASKEIPLDGSGGESPTPLALSSSKGCPSSSPDERKDRTSTGSAQAGGGSNFTPAKPDYRVRRDGWTAARQMEFVAALARTGCVRDACRVARISSTSAYRYRRRDPVFADAWDAALVEARPALEASAYKRAVDGVEEPIVSAGKVIGTRTKYSDPLLKTLLDRDDVKRRQRLGGQPGVLTFEEWENRWRFDWKGTKYQEAHVDEIRERLRTKFEAMIARIEEDEG